MYIHVLHINGTCYVRVNCFFACIIHVQLRPVRQAYVILLLKQANKLPAIAVFGSPFKATKRNL